MDDINRLAENPLSMEDISKFLRYFAEDPNFRKFFANNPFYPNYSPPPPPKTPPTKKATQKVSPDADLIFDTFEFGNEVHVLVGTNRTDLHSVAFTDTMQLGHLPGLAKIRNLNLFQYFGDIVYTINPYTLSQGEKRG